MDKCCSKKGKENATLAERPPYSFPELTENDVRITNENIQIHRDLYSDNELMEECDLITPENGQNPNHNVERQENLNGGGLGDNCNLEDTTVLYSVDEAMEELSVAVDTETNQPRQYISVSESRQFLADGDKTIIMGLLKDTNAKK